MSPPELLVQTTNGPVRGFADTFGLRDSSAATEIAGGADGGKKPVLKWLVSRLARQRHVWSGLVPC